MQNTSFQSKKVVSLISVDIRVTPKIGITYLPEFELHQHVSASQDFPAFHRWSHWILNSVKELSIRWLAMQCSATKWPV